MEPVARDTELWSAENYDGDVAALSYDKFGDLVLGVSVEDWNSFELTREDARRLFWALGDYLVSTSKDQEEEINP